MRRRPVLLGGAAWILLAASCGKAPEPPKAPEKVEAPAPETSTTAPQPPSTPASASASASGSAEAPPAAAASLSLSVFRRTAQGTQVRVAPNYPFRSGDSIRLGITASESGYFYLLLKGSSGRTRMLFPVKRIAGGTNAIEAGQEVVLPAEGWMKFDKNPGKETLYAVFSRSKDQVLFTQVEQAAGIGPASDPSVEQQVLGLLQQRSRSMTIAGAPVPGAAPAAGSAAVPMVVTGQGSLVATLELGHE